MIDDALDPATRTWLRRLRFGLAALPAEEREEIVAEVAGHLAERGAQGVADPLEGFDDPETYAAVFVAERALAGALAGGGSLALARSLLNGRLVGGLTWLAVVPLVVMQLFALGLLVAAALKPFMPGHVGLFVGSAGHFQALGAYRGPLPRGVREILGWWTVPLFVGVGTALLVAGMRGMRALARRRLARTEAVRRALEVRS